MRPAALPILLFLLFPARSRASSPDEEIDRRLAALEDRLPPVDADMKRLEALRQRYLETFDPRPVFAERQLLFGSLNARLDRIDREVDAIDDVRRVLEMNSIVSIASAAMRRDAPSGNRGAEVIGYQLWERKIADINLWRHHARDELHREDLSFEQARGDWDRKRLMLYVLYALAALLAASGIPVAWALRRRRAELSGYKPGAVIAGHYRVNSQAGSPALGFLYEAEDLELRRPVWLQAFHPDILQDRRLLEDVLEGTRMAARLRHPAILEIYNIVQEGARAALVMGRGPAASLRDWLARGARLSLPAAARLFLQAAEGLDCAHAQGIVHGGLEPCSLLIGQDGAVKLRDFVYSRRARPALPRRLRKVLETAQWEAPELKGGAAPSAASDVYALGALLREAAGELPPEFQKSLSNDPALRPTARGFADALRRGWA